MRITFMGATKTVTGSCFLVDTINHRFLVDCGLFQGEKSITDKNDEEFKFIPSDIDFVLLTHAHIDHSGRLPLLRKKGFKNAIYSTKATMELCQLLLPDSAHIQEMDNEWENRKRKRAGLKPIDVLYNTKDAYNVLRQFKMCRYNNIISITENIKIRFKDAGHILGSCITEIWITENGKETKVVFSGDLGKNDTAIIRNPEIVDSCDYLIMESTYGNRVHDTEETSIKEFIEAIQKTIKKGGNIVIPSFAVGRTQEIIYYLNKHISKFRDGYNQINKLPVFVDSPLAINATGVFRSNLNIFDKEAREYIENGDNPLDFKGLQFTKSVEESKMINRIDQSKIIISASGMCNAGRIKHHLKHNLWRDDSTVVFVGYQAKGTLGRKILDGALKVKIFNEEISVKADIVKIDGFSGHADKNELFRWINAIENKPKKVFLVHGEENSIEEFANTIQKKLNIETIIPDYLQTYFMTPSEVKKETQYVETKEVKQKEILDDFLDKISKEYQFMKKSLDNQLDSNLTDEEIDKLYFKLTELEKTIVGLMK